MLQYFTEQLQSAPPLDETGAAAMISRRVSDGADEAKTTEHFKSKIGQRLVYFIKRSDSGLEVLNAFEDELDDVLKGLNFVEMSSSGKVPAFA
jgi:hypothetical protein